jgi:hypothetical protein
MKLIKMFLKSVGAAFGLSIIGVSLVSMIQTGLNLDWSFGEHWKSYYEHFSSHVFSAIWLSIFIPALIVFVCIYSVENMKTRTAS